MYAVVFVGLLVQHVLAGTLEGSAKFVVIAVGYAFVGAYVLGPGCILADGRRGSPKTGLAILSILVLIGTCWKLLLSWIVNRGAA
jgi:hypothetical protein